MSNFIGNQGVFLVAEVSANHGQEFDRAVALVKKAKECGADAVKFQAYTPDTLTIDADNKYFQIKHPEWGGQTLYELLRTGTPTIGICIVDNQEMGMKNWKRVGCLEYLGWYDQKHLLDRLKRAISKLLMVNERRKRSRIGRKYLDGKGPSRVIDFLLKLNN